MKSGSSRILDELFSSRINESYNDRYGVNFVDLPVVTNKKRLQKLISQSLTSKYSKVFQEFGGMGVDVEIYTEDSDKYLIDDVVSSVSMSLVFDTDIKDKVKGIQNIIKRFMKNYPDFKYEKSDNSFWFEVDDYDDIIDVFDTISRTDRVNLGRDYEVLDAYEVEQHYKEQMNEWQSERDELDSYYNSTRL